ncbi:hypothetical protein D3C74_368620 [compost metagenome]
MGERVLESNRMSGRPPGLSIFVCRISCQYTAESLYVLFILGKIHFQFIHPFKIKAYTAETAINLKRVRTAMSRCKACCFKAAQCTSCESCQEQRRVVNGHFSFRCIRIRTALSAQSCHLGCERSFFDKCFAHTDNFLEFTNEETSQID